MRMCYLIWKIHNDETLALANALYCKDHSYWFPAASSIFFHEDVYFYLDLWYNPTDEKNRIESGNRKTSLPLVMKK